MLLQVYKILKSRKLKINNYNFTNSKCTIASSQVCNFAKLQNLEITNLQLNKLQVHICKFVQVCNITHLQNLEIANCKL